MTVKGYLICRKCGERRPQYTYDCDVQIVCRKCDTAGVSLNRSSTAHSAAVITDKNPASMSKRELLAEGKRILSFFHRYAKEGRCAGDIVSGWDWPTMQAVFPELCNRWDTLKTEFKSRYPKTPA